MRLLPVISLFLSICPAAFPEQGALAKDPKDSQVNAATVDAMEGLKRKIVTVRLTPDLTIEDLLERVGGNDKFEKTLRGAEQLGGARWLGDQAVQVRLSIDGNRISRSVLQIVHAHPDHSPISLQALEQDLQQLAGRTFSATGTSTGAGDIGCLRPSEANRAWWGVNDTARRAALTAARDNAISRVIEALSSIPMDGKTLGQAIAESGKSDAVKSWLKGRPVEAVEFDDDLSVKLTLATPVDELWPLLRSAIEHQTLVSTPSTQAQWDQLHQAVAARIIPARGTGVVQPAKAASPIIPTLIPAEPPLWATQELEVEETSPDQGARLRTARRAEALALEKLRHQVDGLPLSGGLTLGSAAHQDPAVEQGVVHALSRARPVKVDYGAKGAVTVRVAFRLSDLWAELSGQQ